MKTYNTQAEFDADIVNGVFKINDDVTFNFNLVTNADIKAWDIDAENIKAGNINAWNIDAENIDAADISYYAVCFAYKNIKCKSITGRRENSKHFCLDGVITKGNAK